MSAKYEDAKLILQLYELRREALLRQARAWFGRDFRPASVADILDVQKGENGVFFRMVTSYWEMAATLVAHGAIDAALFHEAGGEHIFTYAKLEPFLADLRKATYPGMLTNLEKIVRAMPNSADIVKGFQARIAAMPATAKR